ncbi:MAG: glycine/sarcosine/betaine reductase selenoprotein B family protein [Aggregatilineales bacterium]
MSNNNQNQETFQEYKDSFSYGSRPDLNFKFMSAFTDPDAAKYIQDLLWKIGDTLNTGDLELLREHIIRGQTDAYMNVAPQWTYDEGDFTPLTKPISKSRLALLTSSGHFIKGDDPKPFGIENLTQEASIKLIDNFLKIPPTLSKIPVDTPIEDITVRHPGYDIRGTTIDHNVNLPLKPLRQLADEGMIGEFLDTAYSFVGACSQLRLRSKIAPQWAQMLKDKQVDLAILVPV